jgi:large subunit ribosomal protein L24
MTVRRNDIVVAIRGEEAGSGKSGKVLQVLPESERAIVEGFNLVKRHMRKSQDNPKGSIVEKEAPMAISNLALFCPHCKKGVRVKRIREAERWIRSCRKCNHHFDVQ